MCPNPPSKVDANIVLILQMRKLRHRKVKQLSQGQTANKLWRNDSDPALNNIL